MNSKILLTPKSCPNCNKYFYAGAEEFCPKCGQKIEREELTENTIFMACIFASKRNCNYVHYISKEKDINVTDSGVSDEALREFIEMHNDTLRVITLPNKDTLIFSLIHPISDIKFECCREDDEEMEFYFEFFYKEQYTCYDMKLDPSHSALEGSNKEALETISALVQFSLENYLILPKARTGDSDNVAFYPYAIMQCMKSTLDKFKEEHPDEYNTIMLAEELKE